MDREATLVGVGMAVLVIGSVLAVTVPGVLADAGSEPVEPSKLSVREQTIAAGHVSGGTATLSVTSRLTHRGATASNVTVLIRAIDLETDLVATARKRTLDSVPGEREVPVEQNVSVPRNGDYRIETIVFADGRRVSIGSKTVRGVGALQPAYAETGVDFHRFEGFGTGNLPPLHFSIASVEDGEATMNVSAYLTNSGDEPNEKLNVTLMARQADSNIVADKTVVPVGTIDPGRTATPTATLTVPDNYNYKLLAIAQKDDVIVSTAQATATLDPAQPVTVNESEGDGDTLDTGDFQQQDTTDAQTTVVENGADYTEESSGDGPGFTPLAALVAVVASALLIRRHK